VTVFETVHIDAIDYFNPVVRVARHSEDLQSLKPKVDHLPFVHSSGKVRGVIVTVKGSTDDSWRNSRGELYDFASRYFAPWVGINEDPVTGQLSFESNVFYVGCWDIVLI
jgi:predicted PhzF superfamily epimerase YddE/YHI9